MVDVILPVLNERAALPWVLQRMPSGFNPIVVDNGSTDGSAAVARFLGARVVVEDGRGFGAACWTGLTTSTSEVVCFMDCDGSLDPTALPNIAAPVQSLEYDLVLGARNPRAGSWPLHARLANRALALEIRRRTGVVLRDIGPMRAARREPLIDLQIEDRRSGWPLEMVLKAIRAGWRLLEVEVEYHPRTGKSKVTGSVQGTLHAVADMARALR
jgi:glycosyltransferase involved in cell wall biosynthesis